MIFTPTQLEDAYLIEVERQTDERGFLARTFCEREFDEDCLTMRIVQSSTIHSPRKHTLRGLHYQARPHTGIAYVPEGFAQGYQTLEGDAEVLYQMSHEYVPEAARRVRWNDPALAIEWPPGRNRILSERDLAWPDLEG